MDGKRGLFSWCFKGRFAQINQQAKLRTINITVLNIIMVEYQHAKDMSLVKQGLTHSVSRLYN